MTTTTRAITNMEDLIDSRDVIARIEHLETELHDAHEGTGGETADLPFEDWLIDAADDDAHTMQDAARELRALYDLRDEASGYAADWEHGETLIRDSYFETYARELADDIGAIKSDAEWPARHIDWKAAAEELQTDYTDVDFDGVGYWIR